VLIKNTIGEDVFDYYKELFGFDDGTLISYLESWVNTGEASTLPFFSYLLEHGASFLGEDKFNFRFD
jgi:hypothetical protein